MANLAGNTFNDAQTSYHHKSIGGYSGVKLRRYQDLIDFYLQGELQQGYRAIAQAQGRMTQVDPDTFKILNMLNTKYFILSGSDGNTVPVENPYRYGNAWFPNQIQWVVNADEEILALPKTDLQHVAIVDQRYRDRVQGERFEPDSTASIVNTLCKPDHLQYQYNSSRDQLVVFSEVFYDKGGWDVTLDGQPVSHFRADYILRAMTIPAGKHEIDFHYTPHARVLGCKVSNIASVVCIMVILLGLALGMKRQQRS